VIKLVFCLRRLPSLTREEFQRYWLDRHGPLVRAHAATLGIRRYVQTHTLDVPVNDALRASRGGPEGYDGVAELWWDGAEALAAATTTPEGRAAAEALLEDERRFIDLARSPLFVAVERSIIA
jgi:uncharacterized protein (TIGR02118 family)